MSERALDANVIDPSPVIAEDLPADEPSINTRAVSSLADDHGLDVGGGKQQIDYNDPLLSNGNPPQTDPTPRGDST